MPQSILVDTDVLIDFLCGYNKAIAFMDEFSSRIILSPIVIAELYAGIKDNDKLTSLREECLNSTGFNQPQNERIPDGARTCSHLHR
jgi:predicted nucleic acid-binding protein